MLEGTSRENGQAIKLSQPGKVERIQQVLIDAIVNYNELNPATIDELEEELSPLEFSRYVARNRPFVIRGAARDWTAVRTWSASRLRELMSDSAPVKVAVTPHGNADAIIQDPRYPTGIFVEPLETFEPFADALVSIIDSDPDRSSEVRYLQTQNGNLSEDGEYAALLSEVPSSIPWARIALGETGQLDAVNFWLGSDRSTTALHRDNYENVYIQVRGRKLFTLLPPIAGPAVDETAVKRGRYVRDEAGRLQVEVHEGEQVPVPTWDPVRDASPQNVYGQHVQSLNIVLNEGDMMYLPAMWYHHVRQENGAEGFNCSVNYWYDMDFSGGFWTTNALLKDLAMLAKPANASDEP